MGPERLERLLRVYEEVANLPAAERVAHLEAAGLDDEQRAEVERMLAAEGGPESFLAPIEPESRREPARDPRGVGPYTILRRLAFGGMGVVYEAEGSHPRRRVALKLLRSEALTPALARRFRYETEVLARLRHPGIAHLYESGVDVDADGVERPWFAMEFVEGATDLIRWAQDSDPDLRTRLELFAEVCDAVQHGHGRGIVHRDLKPSNVLVDASGRPKVIDFGVARTLERDPTRSLATRTGELVGTLTYMSPEQFGGTDEVDTRTDVYGLGLLMYELLYGQRPFDLDGKGMADIARVVCESPPLDPTRLRPELPADLSWIVLRALEKEPARRYASAAELAADIRRYLDLEPVLARPQSTLYRFRKFTRRNRVLVGAGVAILASLLIGGVVAVAGLARAARDADTFKAINELLVDTLTSAGVEDEGRDVRAASLLDEASERLGRDFGGRPQVAAPLRSALAGCYVSLGLWAEARDEARRAIDLWDQFVPPDDDRRLADTTLLLLGLLETDRMDEFQACLEDALAATEHLPPTDVWRLELRRFEAMGRGLLEGRAATVGLFRSLYEDCRVALGEDDPGTLRARDYMVQGLEESGAPEAIEERRALLAKTEELFGPDAPRSIEQRLSLARSVGFVGQTEEAFELFESAMQPAMEVVGPQHSLVLNARNNHALVLGVAGRFEDAVAELEDLAQDLEALGGGSLLETVRENLAAYRTRVSDSSVDALREAFEAGLDDPSSPESLHAMRRLGTGLIEAGEPDEGEAILLELRAMVEEGMGVLSASEHMRLEQALANAAFERGETLAGLARLSEARRHAERAFGPGHTTTEAIQGRLRAALAELDR